MFHWERIVLNVDFSDHVLCLGLSRTYPRDDLCLLYIFGLGLVPRFLVKEAQGRNSKHSGCSIEPAVLTLTISSEISF